MNNSMVESIADFVLRHFSNVPVYAEIHGEKKAYKTVSDALRTINPEVVSSLVLKDKEHNVLGEIHVKGM